MWGDSMTIRKRLAGLFLTTSLIAAAAGASAELSPADRAAYSEAFRLLSAGKIEQGYAAAWRAESTEGRRIFEWLMLQKPNSGRNFQDIVAFIEARPHWPRMRVLRRRAEEAMDSRVTDAEAAAFFEKHPPVSSEGVERYSAILAARGERDKAATLAREFWRDANLGAVREREFLGAVGRWITRDDHAARMNRLLWEGKTKAAHRMLERVSADHRALGSARIALQKRSKSGANAIRNVPATLARRDDGLRYDHARWLRRREDLGAAHQLSIQPPSEPDFADVWWTERRILGRKLIRAERPSAAFDVASAHGNEDGVAFVEGEFMAGWLLTRFLDDPLKGYRRFDNLFRASSSPISQSRGAYWAGRASEAVGDEDLAKRWYAVAAARPTAYYGQLAAARLGHQGPPRFPPAPQPTIADERAYAADDLAQAIGFLREIGANDHLRSLFFGLRNRLETPGQKILLARELRDAGRLNLSLSMAKTLAREGVIVPDLLYPVIPLHGGETPEAALTLALIRQESAFDLDAVSRAGARGLMQLMPGTAKKVAKGLGLRYSRNRLTTDASYNMTLGRAYMTQRLARFGDSYPLALAAYNAGSHRVDQWLLDFGDPRDPATDAVDWVEMIPFTETRNYVMRILESVQVYRTLTGRAQMAGPLPKDAAR